MADVVFDLMDEGDQKKFNELFGEVEFFDLPAEVPDPNPPHLRDVFQHFAGAKGMTLAKVVWGRSSIARPADEMDAIPWEASYRLSLCFTNAETGEQKTVFVEFDDTEGPSRDVTAIGSS